MRTYRSEERARIRSLLLYRLSSYVSCIVKFGSGFGSVNESHKSMQCLKRWKDVFG